MTNNVSEGDRYLGMMTAMTQVPVPKHRKVLFKRLCDRSMSGHKPGILYIIILINLYLFGVFLLLLYLCKLKIGNYEPDSRL